MTGRERAALAGRPIALNCVFQRLHERLRDDLRAHQIESDVRPFVGPRPACHRGHNISTDRP